MLKSSLRYWLLERDESIKEQYQEYLRENNVSGMTGKLKKGVKLLQLNASLKKDMEQPEKPHFSVPVDELLERLKPYDIISFDVFDTLIFRRDVYKRQPMGGVLARLAAHRTFTSPVIYTAHGFHFYQGAPKKNWLLYYQMCIRDRIYTFQGPKKNAQRVCIYY